MKRNLILKIEGNVCVTLLDTCNRYPYWILPATIAAIAPITIPLTGIAIAIIAAAITIAVAARTLAVLTARGSL